MIEPTTDWQLLERVSRRSLAMFDLTERERSICEVVIEWSFARGRESAVIPDLDSFVDLTGVAREDVSRTIDKLLARRVIQRRGPRGARIYEFLPSASYWREAKPRFDPERAAKRAVQLDQLNRQMRFGALIEEPDLDDAMASVSREEALVQAPAVLTAITAVEPSSEVGDLPTLGAVGDLPTTGGVGDLPISPRDARVRAGGSTRKEQYTCTAVHVGDEPKSRTRFRDSEKNHVFEQFEALAGRQARDRDDLAKNRFTWLRRFTSQDFGVIRRAFGIVREREQDRNNKRDKPLGAVFYRECVRIARETGKRFHLW